MLQRIVDMTALLFEAGGAFAMSAGAIVALGLALRERAGGGTAVYHSTEPTLQQVVVLGLIVLIRTFLSFSLEIELERRWPWQPRQPLGDER